MGVMRFFGRLRTWTTGHWLRGVIVASTMLIVDRPDDRRLGIPGKRGTAHRARSRVDGALAAFDEGNYEEARTAVSHMLTGGSCRAANTAVRCSCSAR